MYFNILKRDLKRKKTMNMILLIFIILATMFVASSVNNILAVSSALDYYFEKAGMSDYYVLTQAKSAQEDNIKEVLDEIACVNSYETEPILYITSEQIISDKEIESNGSIIICPFQEAKLNYFDKNNQIITKINPGEVYIQKSSMEKNNLEVGDIVTIKVGEVSRKLTVAGGFKDAFLGSDMMGNTRFFVHQKDYEELISDNAAEGFGGNICYINTEDIKEIEQLLSKADTKIVFNGDKNMIAMTYVMNMVIAGCLLVVSICLILIAFVVLRFTITFTLSEEYREIGVMKAIGIKNTKIRGLYLVKYLALSVVGAVIGLAASIPFGNMLLQSVSQSIVMDIKGGYLVHLACAMAVVGIILLFCFKCTGKVKKFTPIDAIRSGSNGERYKSKGILSLSKSKMKPVGFMAVNDILSSIKRYVIMILTFTISLTLVLIIVNTINTLKSEKLINCFSMAQSDVYMVTDEEYKEYMKEDGREKVQKRLAEIEAILEKQGMPSKCFLDAVFKLSLSNGEYNCKSLSFQGTGNTTAQYTYMEGTPPENECEIAVTKIVAGKLNAQIGDTITISSLEGEREYIITALFQSMNNMGEGVRFHETAEISYAQAMGFWGYQITFTDEPDKKTKEQRMEEIEKIFNQYEVCDGGTYVDNMIGGIAESLRGVRNIVVAVMLIINILVVILMERSFIAKETGEIAILKAIGFRNSAIMQWHTLRIGVVLTVSTIIATAISNPVTKLTSGQIFKMMGADYGIEFEINPLEVYAIYPLFMFVVTLIAVFVTTWYTRKISASESSNIE